MLNMATSNTAVGVPQLSWNPQDIQKFIGTVDHDLQQIITDLSPLDSTSIWLIPHQGDRFKLTNGNEESSKVTNQDASEETSSFKSSNESPASSCLTTVGLLLIATLTCQKESQTLIESVRNLIKQSFKKPNFHKHLQKIPSLEESNLDGLVSMCNFCLGHCLLCNTDGRAIQDMGVLKAWSITVQPLALLLDSLIIGKIIF